MKFPATHSSTRAIEKAAALLSQGKAAEAQALLSHLLTQHHEHADAWHLMGISHYLMNDLPNACSAFQKAIQANPKQPDFHANLGLVLQTSAHIDEAALAYTQALVLDPNHVDALFNLATLHQERHELDEAIELYQRSLALRRAHAKTHYNLGTVYASRLQHGEALGHFRQAVDLSPTHTESWVAMANSCHALGEISLALQCLDSTLRIAPDHPAAHLNRALLMLATGDYKNGWPEFEWRWRAATALRSNYRGNRPLWLGQTPTEGMHLLLHCEQGFGDTFQCTRYFETLQERGVQLTVLVEPSQVRLLQRMKSAPKLITPDAELPVHDAHCPLMSLPLALGLTDHPAMFNTPYLTVDEDDLQRRRNVLGFTPERPAIGLAWRGSSLHSNDKQRSLPLDQLLARLPLGPSYVVLQKDVSPLEQEILMTRPDVSLVVQPADDFYDTATLCCTMDQIVSVDTSIVHLAGALGCPTLLMLAQPCDWRWQPNTTPNPWYGCVEILRQPQPGDWESVLNQMHDLLQHFKA